MAIYLLKRNTGLTNRQIGQMFGDMSYSAVTKAYQRFSAELKKNRRLRKDLQEILAVLSKVKT
jgi:chromosomal replication initiation ATPase DnaA